MAKFDLETRGITAGINRWRVATSATRALSGEPLINTPSYTTGVTNSNVVIQCANDQPVIGTHEWRGLCAQDFEVDSAAVVTAHYTKSVMYIPYATKCRGRIETTASMDTQAELTGFIGDLTRFHRSATPDYRIQVGGEADTGPLQVVDGNFSKGTVDCVVDGRAFRTDVTA